MEPTGSTPPPPGKRYWTPEILLQAFKEVITAILGVAVVIFTLVLANSTYNAIIAGSDLNRVSGLKDILLLVMGLSGVVIGYYFGRIPSDARAAQAQEQVNVVAGQAAQAQQAARAAQAQTERLGARAAVLADQVEWTVSRMNGGPGSRGSEAGANGSTSSDLERLRDELKELASMARSGQ